MISVVVPLFNEEHSLDALYHEIAAVLDSQPEPYEVVFVDDGSTDGTAAMVRSGHPDAVLLEPGHNLAAAGRTLGEGGDGCTAGRRGAGAAGGRPCAAGRWTSTAR